MIGTEVISEFLINSEESKVVIITFLSRLSKSKITTDFKSLFIQFVFQFS